MVKKYLSKKQVKIAGISIPIILVIIALILVGAYLIKFTPLAKEVFMVNITPNGQTTWAQAEAKSAEMGYPIATPNQVANAYKGGAQWWSRAFASDGNTYFPYQSKVATGASAGINPADGSTSNGVLLYGKKPAEQKVQDLSKANVLYFYYPPGASNPVSSYTWSMWQYGLFSAWKAYL